MAVLKPDAAAADATGDEAGGTITPRAEGAPPGPRACGPTLEAAPAAAALLLAGSAFVCAPLELAEAGAGVAAEPGGLWRDPPLPGCGSCGLKPLWTAELVEPKGGCRAFRVAALPLAVAGGRRGAGVRDSADDRMVL
ncbi:hypothetical protein DUNSADRAFT_5804 [Dunaliella salina]|uniref:Uncharacterized protein n=1 Tax=Dunaliella salina TaxID=3046 RepID=A0ABQ7GPN6_DUNSA|nr:hypothetical protein DUNSADRAFT_5804 [Dunaliella salina]|eukprot:KAF5836567.1 hypothetical protein DUNSADRAFT_5804 [Dunaliella salina]